MESKEIIISSVILVLLLIGFALLMRNKSPGSKNDDTINAGQSSGITTTNDLNSDGTGLLENDELIDNSGFESRNQQNQQQPGQQLPNSIQEKPVAPQTPPMILKENTDYSAKFTTNMGSFEIDLFEDKTPITVNNFVFLAKNKFYDGLIFHRVIQDFMIQGGDPNGNGTGGPGYSFQDEITREPLVRGSLAMANSGKNTNGSQFFIVTKEETPWLNKLHTNFGMVTDGLDVVMKIEKVKTGPNDKPVEDVVINNITILERRADDYE